MTDRELDVLIQRYLIGTEVPGNMDCWLDECAHWSVSYTSHTGFPQPVFMRQCMCWLKDDPDPIDESVIQAYGHIAPCFEVVPFYTTTDLLTLKQELVGRNWHFWAGFTGPGCWGESNVWCGGARKFNGPDKLNGPTVEYHDTTEGRALATAVLMALKCPELVKVE